MSSTKNPIWQFYTKHGNGYAICNDCKNKLKTYQSNTTALLRHLQSAHKDLYATFIAIKEASQPVTPKSTEKFYYTTQKGSQQSEKTNIKWKRRESKQLKWDMEVAELLVNANLPYTFVDSPAWKKFAKYACPSAQTKSSRVFARSKIPALSSKIMEYVDEDLKKDLAKVDQVSFTTDGWTSKANHPYLSLTTHYISSHFEFKSYTLDCKLITGSHTRRHIAEVVDSIIQQHPGLNQVQNKMMVTDAASNMRQIDTVSEEITDNQVCLDHIINTCLQRAMNSIPEIKNALDEFT